MNLNPAGTLTGGWEFVQAVYAISGLVLVFYFFATHLRYRAERQRAERENSAKGAP